MKVSNLLINAVLASTVSAGWIYPSKSWRYITQTLPGSSYRKRDAADPLSERLVERGGADLYKACSTLNLVSKYNKYPINGLSAGGVSIENDDDAGDPIVANGYVTNSAYGCCVLAQQMPDSAGFYYTSSPNSTSIGFFGNGVINPGANCFIIITALCQNPTTQTIILGAQFNGSEPRGTSYGNYMGNGRCGPGFTVAQDTRDGSICSRSDSFSAANSSTVAAYASACGYVNPGTPDLGGPTPAG